MLRLFRVLSAQGEGDRALWAERGFRRHPRSHVLALAGLPLLPEPDRAARLGQFLETCVPHPESEQRAAAAAAFARAVEETVAPRLATPEAVALLRRAARTFPESARIAALLGQALDLSGETVEAQQHYAHALTLRRNAEVYRREFGPGDALLRRCLVAGYARNWPAPPG